MGGPKDLHLERYSEALLDPGSGLTHTALAGLRKQSVQDAERMFSIHLADFMRSKNYTFEEKYVRVVCNWRRANDERGLSELERSRFNYDFLNFILEVTMISALSKSMCKYKPPLLLMSLY